MKKFFNKIKTKLSSSVIVVKDNFLLIAMVLMATLSDLILRGLTVGGIFKIKPLLTSLSIMLLLSSLLILFSNKKRRYVYIVFLGLVSILNLSHYLYYTHFNTFLSVGIFKQAKQLTEMKNNLTNTINVKSLLFFIPVIIYIVVYKHLEKNNYFELRENKYTVTKEFLSAFTLGAALMLVLSLTLTSTDVSRIKKQWNREYLVEEFGVYTYSTADFVKVVTVPRTVEADYADFDEKVNDLVKHNTEKKQTNEFTNILEGKDLYVIHYESVQTFAMDLAFEDGEVTPFLNKLSKEGMFFNNFYPQHSIGTSSDSEFTFSTSLYPINNRTVFLDHADKEYNSIQKLLGDKGYHTMSMHGNNGGFWNRIIMHDNLGYQEFVDKFQYDIDEVVGLGLSDMSFYKQSVQKLKAKKEANDQPIMATIISLSNHYPFDELDVYGDFDTGYLEDTKMANYLKSMNYADQALELFFEEMEKEGLLDNAAVLIYGDHHAKISTGDFETIYNYDEETGEVKDSQDEDYISVDNAYLRQVRRTPLILWTKDRSFNMQIDEPIGMIDVMPTIGNMMNFFNPYQLGNDIFSIDENRVIFPNGSFITKDYYYNSSNLSIYDMKTNELIKEKDDFDEAMNQAIHEVEETLEFSQKIIENNLIKYNKTDQKRED